MFHVNIASRATGIRRHLVRAIQEKATSQLLFPLCIWCFATLSVHGAPTVVKQLSYSDGGTVPSGMVGSPPPTSVPFDFRIYEPNVFPTPVYTTWLQYYSPADVGMSFFAPPEVVAAATAARSSTTAIADLEVNFGGFHQDDFGPWWVGFPPGHYITAIERVLDNLVLIPISENLYTMQFAQRIRVWAEPIPEPRTIGLLAIAISLACISRLMACGRRRPKFRLPCYPNSAASSRASGLYHVS
jgi:hypothetical protein